MDKEPAAIVAGITGLASAIIALVVAFGVEMDDTQQQAILGVVAVAAPIVAGFIIRQRVVSPAATGEAVARAKLRDPATPEVPEVDVPHYEGAVIKHMAKRGEIRPLKFVPPPADGE